MKTRTNQVLALEKNQQTRDNGKKPPWAGLKWNNLNVVSPGDIRLLLNRRPAHI
jgi:hypothetical protein